MKVNVDRELCTQPRDCRLCLDRCQEKVFAIYPRQRRAAGVRADNWVITPVFSYQCTGCQDCLSFCPPGAISLS
jgi:ferredoxin